MISKFWEKNFWKSITLVEFGFLWSVLFAVWGPVPRYLGWLLVIVGLINEKVRKIQSGDRGVLHTFVKVALFFILLWGLLFSALKKPDLYSFLKGYSLAMEFAFSLWLATRVFSEEALRRFWVVLVASVFLAIFQSLYAFFFENNFAGPFSNINTLGLYGVIILPFFISRALQKKEYFCWIGSAGIFFLLILSSSSAAWISTVACLALLVILEGKKYFWRFLSLILLSVVLFAAFWGVLEKTNPELKGKFASYIKREYRQLSAFDEPSKFTNHRIYIWKGSLELVKRSPYSGWGWGPFAEPFREVNSSWLNTKKTQALLRHTDDAHNMYLNLAVYGGIPSMVAVVFLFLFTAHKAFVLSRQDQEKRWFWIATTACILTLLIYSIAGDVFSARYKYACIFWYFMGFSGRKFEA